MTVLCTILNPFISSSGLAALLFKSFSIVELGLPPTIELWGPQNAPSLPLPTRAEQAIELISIEQKKSRPH
jgi:hypothetical protein